MFVDTDEVPQASWDLYEMIQAFLQAPSYHVYFEIFLLICIGRLLFFTKSYKPARTQLTEKEKEELIEEWQPENLISEIDPNHPTLLNFNRLIQSKIGKEVILNNKTCLNLASMNFLSMASRKEIEKATASALRKYGVGSCGPRGFYGTVDVHLNLEKRLEQLMNCEEAILYSYGFATIASAIPAYSKRGDVVFADEGVHFAIQKGIQASRSKVFYFKHNDMKDLERLLKLQQDEDLKNPKKAKVIRRFLVVEGLYLNYGDICPLPQIIEFKYKYKVRIFLDETISFGTLGQTGRGVTEHFNFGLDDVDLMAGSLEYSMASVGGFCCGKSYVIDHQRLSGLGYCFSASCPPMLAQSAITALDFMEQNPGLLEKLKQLSEYAHQKFQKLKGLNVISESYSPLIHLQVKSTKGRKEDQEILRTIVSKAEMLGVALTLASYLDEELFHPKPSIRISLSTDLTYEEIDYSFEIINKCL